MKIGLNYSRILPFFNKDALAHFEGCHDLKQVVIEFFFVCEEGNFVKMFFVCVVEVKCV